VLFEPLLETNPGVRAHRHRPGRPRRRPEKLHADRATTTPAAAATCTTAGSRSASPESSNHLGRVRWVVERSISWLLRFKRLGLRYDRTHATLRPLLTLACVLINSRRLAQKEF
jgi:hypothetical protein